MPRSRTPDQILFVSLATAVLDNITVAGQVVAQDNVGGSAVFSSLGARLFAVPRSKYKSPVALKINAGHDFPEDVTDLLHSWNMVLDLQCDPHKSSTRAEVSYHDASLESRDFRYTTPVLTVQPSDLRVDSPMLAAKIFHLFTAPQALHEQVSQIAHLRRTGGMELPIIIWEPRSKTYIPENLHHALEAAYLVDIISPHHLELLQLFGQPASGPFDPSQIESFAQVLVSIGIGMDNNGIIVVRCAEHGALVLGRTVPAAWVPAYWQSPPNDATTQEPSQDEPAASAPRRHPQVVDTTGAGNCFLGGFAMGLLETGDPVKAAHYGAVAASFVVQQLGLPKLEVVDCRAVEGCGEGVDDCEGDGGDAGVVKELWNGESVRERLRRQMAVGGP